jgi:hypothetical protein
VIPFLKKGLKIGLEAGINVMVEAIPPCFLKGYEKYESCFITVTGNTTYLR